MPGRKQTGDLLREMSARGFRPLRVDAPGRAWTGELKCRSKSVKVEFHLTDWEFLRYPHIKVTSGIDRSRLLPHLSVEGGLCYFRAGDVVLDRYRPAIAIAQCLEQAQQVLEKLLFDPAFRREDLLGEFDHYWLQDAEDLLLVLLGTIGEKPRKASWRTTYHRLSKDGSSIHVLSDDPEEVKKLAGALGTSADDTTAPCWLFDTDEPPAIPETMPTTIQELFAWLKTWDRGLYRRIQDVLGSEREYLRYKAAHFAVRSPGGWLGFGFYTDPAQRGSTKRTLEAYRHYLHQHGAAIKFFRLCIGNVSPSFVHSRNLTHPDLSNKRITVVGCGAIGSYVAQALVRLGAGTGSGLLLLIDPDILLPENLGRHVLGYPALFKNKAKAMAHELQTCFPLARVEAITVSAVKLSSLFDADLVVDATGDEAVAAALNAKHLENAPSTPVLHAWILGNGEAAQALWVNGDKHACYRCLRIIDNEGQLQYRFPILKEDTERRQIGCHAFTPYAVSAPLQAAGLVAEMVVDWLKLKNPSPRFRTRLSENANVSKVKNQDVGRLKECMACGRDLQQSV